MKTPAIISVQEISLEEVSIQVLNDLNLKVRRVYTIETQDESSTRGNHAHYNQSQLIQLCSGAATLKLTNQKGEEFNFKLNKDYIYIPKKHWIELQLAPHTKVICLASKQYKNLKSTEDKAAFLAD